MAKKRTKSRIDQELASKILRTVPIPQAFLFFTDIDEYTNEFSPCLADFLDKLKELPLRSIEFHFKRGDFERWIRETLGDEYLANRINKIDKTIHGEKLRSSIHRIAKRRLNQLNAYIKNDL